MTSPASPPSAFAFTSGARPEKLRLGDVLVRQQLITPAQLQQALTLQQQGGKKLGRVLVDSGILTEELLADGLARQLRIPCINLKTYPFRPELVRTLPEAMARRLRVLVLEERSDGLLVGMSDPLDLLAFDDITRTLKRPIHIAVVAESQLLPAFDRLYRRTEEISGLARALEKDMGDAVDFGELTASAGVDGAPVVRHLQTLFEHPAHARASDVHKDPQQ
jgi:MSHA biogenesis protein MshE